MGVSDWVNGLPLSTLRGCGDRRRPESAAPGLISYVRHSLTMWRQPRLTVLHKLSALCRRTPCPSGASWKCSRSGRTVVQPISSDHPSRGREAGPVLRAQRRRGPDPAPLRICPEIPITFRQGERREATIRTRAHEAEILITPN